jgi:hypothetical protein
MNETKVYLKLQDGDELCLGTTDELLAPDTQTQVHVTSVISDIVSGFVYGDEAVAPDEPIAIIAIEIR